MNTQVIGFDIDALDYLKSGLIWTIASRFVQIKSVYEFLGFR